MARKTRKSASRARPVRRARTYAARPTRVRRSANSNRRRAPAAPRTLRIVVETAPQAGVGQLPLTAEALASAQVQTSKKGKAKF